MNVRICYSHFNSHSNRDPETAFSSSEASFDSLEASTSSALSVPRPPPLKRDLTRPSPVAAPWSHPLSHIKKKSADPSNPQLGSSPLPQIRRSARVRIRVTAFRGFGSLRLRPVSDCSHVNLPNRWIRGAADFARDFYIFCFVRILFWSMFVELAVRFTYNFLLFF